MQVYRIKYLPNSKFHDLSFVYSIAKLYKREMTMNQFVYFVTIEIHVYKKYIYQSKIIIKHGLFANV